MDFTNIIENYINNRIRPVIKRTDGLYSPCDSFVIYNYISAEDITLEFGYLNNSGRVGFFENGTFDSTNSAVLNWVEANSITEK